MTDLQTPVKPARKRCPNCKTSFFNDPIDIDAHSKFCPMILIKRIRDLETENDDLTDRITALEETEPAFDLDDVEDLTADELAHSDDTTADIPPAIDRDDDYPDDDDIDDLAPRTLIP